MHNDDAARLWRAVIIQAFADAAAPVNKTAASVKRHTLRIAARAWLLNPSCDLFYVCRLAGEDFNQVMQVARRLGLAGWPDVIERHHRTHTLERKRANASQPGGRKNDAANETTFHRSPVQQREHNNGGRDLGPQAAVG